MGVHSDSQNFGNCKENGLKGGELVREKAFFVYTLYLYSHKWYAILQLQFILMFYLLQILTGTIISYGFAKDHFDVVTFFL